MTRHKARLGKGLAGLLEQPIAHEQLKSTQNKVAAPPSDDQRWCKGHQAMHERSRFGRNRRAADGLQPSCKEWNQDYARRRYKRLKRNRRRAQDNQGDPQTMPPRIRRRANAEGDGVPSLAWLAMCGFFGNVCLACGAGRPLTMDHVIPVVIGGLDHITNVQPLCDSCNKAKGPTILDYRNPARLTEFLIQLRDLVARKDG